MHKDRPKVGMGVYVVRDGKLLLMLRKGANEPGTWSAPGGHLEMGESFLDCAKRELKRETGLDLSTIEILGVVNNIFSPEKHYVNVDVLAKGVAGKEKVMEPEKCEKLAWFDLKNLPTPLMLPLMNLFKEYPSHVGKLIQANSFFINP